MRPMACPPFQLLPGRTRRPASSAAIQAHRKLHLNPRNCPPRLSGIDPGRTASRLRRQPTMSSVGQCEPEGQTARTMHRPGWLRLSMRCLIPALVLLLPACESDSNFTVLGYTTKPNYDCNIKTIRVPIFQNLSTYRDLEFEL